MAGGNQFCASCVLAMNEAANVLKINGLSYDDWENEADRLRLAASRQGRVLKRDLTRTQKLLTNLDAELEAIDRVSASLKGIDAVRVQCTRDLLVALQAGLAETLRRLQDRPSGRGKAIQQE
jgi:hypothetical protein